MKVAAVVISHGNAAEVDTLLPALRPQVDDLVLIANVPERLPAGVRTIENEQPLGFAANANLGIAATTAELVLIVNPDAVPEAGAVEALRRFMEEHPRCGVAGPQMLYPDGTWQPSRRRFPTVSGTIVRRTPLRRVLPPSRAHYNLDERPAVPVRADWMLGGFMLLRREMLVELGGLDPGFRLYGEDIDLCYRAAKAGWERWYVPEAVVRHAHQAETDRRWLTRRTLWHWRGIIRFVRKHPETLRAL